MTGRTHDLVAVNTLAVIVLSQTNSHTITLSTVLFALLANQIGGIAPDIDQPTAPFWRNLPVGGFFGRFFDDLMGGHRFLTHSIVGVALFGFLANLLLHFIHPLMPGVDIELVWWAFIIGMLSHLVMDTFTKEGVPWLLPIPIKFGIPPIKALRITTGKKTEKAIFVCIVALDFWYAASHYQEIVKLLHTRIV